MRHPHATLIILISALSAAALAVAADPVVRLENDRLTLAVRDLELTTILAQIADHGIRIRIDPRINPRITATFEQRPMGQAMSSLLKSADYALIWRKDRASGPGPPRLWEIRIFYRGEEERIRPLAGSSNLTVVQGSDGRYYVQDILLLRLAPAVSDADLAVLLDRLGAERVDGFAPLGIVRVRLPHGSDVPAVADSIADVPGIDAAEPDYAYSLDGGRPATGGPWPAAAVPSIAPSSGAAIVAVMDSGMLAAYGSSASIQATYDAVSPGADVNDALGHGTQMALVAAGAVNPLGVGTDAPAGSPVVAVRAVDDNRFTSTYTLIRGIDFAVSQGARVLSLSWGTDTPSAMLEAATRHAADKGLILVAAAGNAPTGQPVYPAAYGHVIGVGALNPSGDAWSQSNYGDFVAVTAPGMADLPVGYNGEPGIYAGTSIATAYTARRIADILNRTPDADQATIVRLLTGEK